MPSGVWAASEYDKLVAYDAPTGEQPLMPFMCHATVEHYCHGWANVHSNRGHAFELLAFRLRPPDNPSSDPVWDMDPAFFDSGTEAAEHGKADISSPSEDARQVMGRLARKYERLRPG